MNYDEVVKTLQTMLEIPLNQTDENFTRILPQIFTYAENRIYRECDFLVTTTSTTATLVANSFDVMLPSTVLVLRQVAVIAPGVAPTPDVLGQPITLDKRYVLERISPEALDMFWPQYAYMPGIPRQYAIIGASAGTPQVLTQVVRLLPSPDKAYSIEYLGVIRPRTLSSRNIETYLSTTYPDLFCAACMVFASGYQRDFGAMADDPQKAMSWEGTYNALRTGVTVEAARQKGEAAGWSSQPPAPVSQPRAP